MEPIRIPKGPFASNMRAVLPGGTEDNDLPCRHTVTETGEGSVSIVQSVWILDDEDLAAISEDPANARIVLTLVCAGDEIPPIGLAIENIPIAREKAEEVEVLPYPVCQCNHRYDRHTDPGDPRGIGCYECECTQYTPS